MSNFDAAITAAAPHMSTSVREQALEEAAGIARHFKENAYSDGMSEEVVMARSFFAHDIETAIRALKAQPVYDASEPIETAPKDGTEILAWREDCGWFIASYTSLDAFPMSQSELDELDEETLFKKDWFTQDGQFRLEGNEVPSRWQPLPPAPQTGGGE